MICTAGFVVCQPRRAADLLANRRQGFLCRHTARTEQSADRAETAVVEHYFSSPTKNIFVAVCLWTPRNRLTIVLWCMLDLPVGGAIPITLLPLQSQQTGRYRPHCSCPLAHNVENINCRQACIWPHNSAPSSRGDLHSHERGTVMALYNIHGSFGPISTHWIVNQIQGPRYANWNFSRVLKKTVLERPSDWLSEQHHTSQLTQDRFFRDVLLSHW